MSTQQQEWKPAEIDRLAMVFGPSRIDDLLPAYSDIPAEFKSSHNKWARFISGWFFSGIKSLDGLKARDGIDRDKALAHIKACLASFEPKHERKEAGCAYLCSLWFADDSDLESAHV